MKERLSTPLFESESGSDPRRFEQSYKNNFLDATGELEPVDPSKASAEEYTHLLDEPIVENSQGESSPITSLARTIIIEALSGNLNALNRLENKDIIGMLAAHIQSTLREYENLAAIPERIIDGMVDIASNALRDTSYRTTKD